MNFCRDTDTFDAVHHSGSPALSHLPASHAGEPPGPRWRRSRTSTAPAASARRNATRSSSRIRSCSRTGTFGEPLEAEGCGARRPRDHAQLTLAYMFVYFIGNLDFSFNGLHNTELLDGIDGRILPVAYDFDFAGAVNTIYATPAADSVRGQIRPHPEVPGVVRARGAVPRCARPSPGEEGRDLRALSRRRRQAHGSRSGEGDARSTSTTSTTTCALRRRPSATCSATASGRTDPHAGRMTVARYELQLRRGAGRAGARGASPRHPLQRAAPLVAPGSLPGHG